MKKKLLIGFFIMMCVFTILSRIVDSVMIPKVSVTAAMPAKLSYLVQGEGVVKAGDISYLDVREGIKVDRVLSGGEEVEAGQTILFYRMSHLEEKRKELEREIQMQRLSLEREELTGKQAAQITNQERLSSQVNQAKDSLDQAQLRLDQAKGEHAQKTGSAKEKLDRDKSMEEERLRLAKEEIDREAGQTVSGNFPQKGYDQAELAYKEAMAAIGDSYESVFDQLGNSLKQAQETLGEKQAAMESMEDGADLAAKEDAYKSQNDQTAAQISGKNQEMIALDLEAKKEKLQELEELIEAGGEVKAPVTGVITKMEVSAGGITSGNEIIEIGSGNPYFAGTLDKEGTELLGRGDKITVLMPAQKAGIEGAIDTISVAGETDKQEKSESEKEIYGEFRAQLPEGTYRFGSTASFTMKKDTEMKYDCVVPLQALREDQNGVYCLIAQKTPSILGEEDVAVRVNVEVIKKDKKQAAIQTVFTEQDLIIIGSNKSISEGDRVRINQ